MSFGFSVSDFIAGADLAHKLIRVMTETRGASIEYQEALAELCGIQQVFIQITQLSRNEILPKATLNSLAQIIMPSMVIIADFLDRTKHYQTRLSRGGGLSGSWCKIGWALYRKEELKLLRDTLHARLSAINTLLAAANHLPARNLPVLPKSVAQFQVAEESAESFADEYPEMFASNTHHDSKLGVDLPVVPRVLACFQNASSVEDVSQYGVQNKLETSECVRIDEAGVKPDALALSRDSSGVDSVVEKAQLNKENNNGMSTVGEVMQAVSSKAQTSHSQRAISPRASEAEAPFRSVEEKSNTHVTNKNHIKKIPQGHKRTGQDLDSYLQNLFEKALTIQAEVEVKTKMAQKAAEEAEWRQRIEESSRLKAEADLHEKMERAKTDIEQERLAVEQKRAANDAFKEQALQEAKLNAEEALRKGLGKDKAPLRFKDAVGRKFSLPYHICQTWQGMEDLIKQAFLHVDVIGPHVQAGHYDLVGPNGEIILPQVWDKVIEPDWAISMHMWPMEKNLGMMGGRNGQHAAPPPRPGGPPMGFARPRPPVIVQAVTAPKKNKNPIKSFMNNKLKRLTRRRSSMSSDSSSEWSSWGP
ncbi:hypothetical protein E0Z10_g1323 [Xylaria hypoxylon]|uniref:Ubiquitin-like domain-containing protein n=1 Tax=Xylaria hypoxylon TaxID=37992 RepID=A0A4Z0YU39_9PEZI|nr:hypothetical protein E0Z10_g1323 [Xylaria hypoxylon]